MAILVVDSNCKKNVKYNEVVLAPPCSTAYVRTTTLLILVLYYCLLQVWKAYKDQKHDLFLPSNAHASVSGVAGLLTGPKATTLALPSTDR